MSQKNILIINSLNDDLSYFINVFSELKTRGINLHLLSADKHGSLYKKFIENNWSAKKIYIGKNNFLSFIIFPFLFCYFFIYLFFIKRSKKINILILFGDKEKNFFSIIGKILKLKVFWIQIPKPQIVTKKILYNFNLRFVNKIIVLNEFTKEQLASQGVRENKILVIKPGIKLNENHSQDNIFNNIAKNQREKKGHKFFTIGVVAELNRNQNIQSFFYAIKDSLKAIPNIQVVIIGDGEERKQFTWMAKTMKIDHLVWFVGHQANLGKWLDSFNLLTVINPIPSLYDMFIVLNSMRAGIPIIAQRHIGLEEMLDKIHKKINTLIDVKDREKMAQKIIQIKQSEVAKNKLAKYSKLKVKNEFGLDLMADTIMTTLQT